MVKISLDRNVQTSKLRFNAILSKYTESKKREFDVKQLIFRASSGQTIVASLQ